MKMKLAFLALFIWTISHGQIDKYRGTWISSSNDVMLINDTLNKYSNSNMLCTRERDEGMAFYLMGDTLSFQKRYYSSRTNYEELYIEKYDLIVTSQTDTSMTVNPVSDLSRKFFDNKRNLRFVKQEFNKDKSIIFEKIIYHTTSCFGSCPKIKLEIKNDKSVYLSGQFYKDDFMYDIDSIKSGRFTGKLSDTLYAELMEILQTMNLKTLDFPEIDGVDGPVTTLIIYYNGQRKYLKSMFPPTLAHKLIKYLYLIRERADLTRTNEKREIER